MLKYLGQLALKLKLGGSRKDALTNVAGYGVLVSGVLVAATESKLLPAQYESAAMTAIAVLGALGFGSSGRSANLDKVQD